MILALASTRGSRKGTARRALLSQSHVALPFLAVFCLLGFSRSKPMTDHESRLAFPLCALTPRHPQHRIAPRYISNAERNFKEERIQ